MELVTELERLYRDLLIAKDEQLNHERHAYTIALTSKDQLIGELRRRAEFAEAETDRLKARVRIPHTESTHDDLSGRWEKIKQLFLS